MCEKNYRKKILDLLIPYFEKDEALILLICDMGFGAIDKLEEQFSSRIVNMGVMEQATIGVAAGLAVGGFKPIVYSICNFLTFRALEQIRLDLIQQSLPVKLIGTGANDYFKDLGSSHTCGDVDAKIMELIGMPVYDPYLMEHKSLEDVVDHWITWEPGPAYLRV